MTLKLYYFDMAGRAEVSRIMLRLTKTEFEDVRIPASRDDPGEWPTKYKPMSPTGQCPFIEVDGTIIAQTAAVETYIGMITGLMPTDPLQAAQVVMHCHTWKDVWEAFGKTWMIRDLEERVAARKPMLADDGVVHLMLSALNKMLGSRSTAFSVSDDLSVADINTFYNMKNFQSGNVDAIDKDVIAKYPHLVELKEKVLAHPKVAPLFAS